MGKDAGSLLVAQAAELVVVLSPQVGEFGELLFKRFCEAQDLLCARFDIVDIEFAEGRDFPEDGLGL